MSTILQLQSGIEWRSRLRPASFRGVRFHVDSAVRDSGRRIVSHEFPKRDLGYAEDMGRRAREFTIRAYLIVYPHENPNDDPAEAVLKKRNYIPQRDVLIRALEVEGPAELELPLLGRLIVVCQRYRITEETKYGGYCVFDLTFIEYGQAPAEGARDSKAGVYYTAADLAGVSQAAIDLGIHDIGKNLPGRTPGLAGDLGIDDIP